MKLLLCLLATAAAANPLVARSSQSYHGSSSSSSSTSLGSSSSTSLRSSSSRNSTTTGSTLSQKSTTSKKSSKTLRTTSKTHPSSSTTASSYVSQSFHKTSTPTCNGLANPNILYTWKTTYVTETYYLPPGSHVIWSDPGPELVLPTPFCTGMIGTDVPPIFGQPTHVVSIVSATVKTTEQIGSSASQAAITFNPPQGHGQFTPTNAPTPAADTNPPTPPPPTHAPPNPGSGGSGGSGGNGGPAPQRQPNSALGAVIQSIFPGGSPPPPAGNAGNGNSNAGFGNSNPQPNFASNPQITPAPGAGGWSASTVAGIGFDVNPTAAVVNGHTFSIGAGAPSTTTVVNGQALTFGANGIQFPGGQSVTPPAPFYGAAAGVTVSADGDFFSFAATDVVIAGTTYAYATPTTVTLADGSEISVGPNGVSIPSASPSVATGAASSLNVRFTAAVGVAALVGVAFL